MRLSFASMRGGRRLAASSSKRSMRTRRPLVGQANHRAQFFSSEDEEMTGFRKLVIASVGALAMCAVMPIAGAMAQASGSDSGSSMSQPPSSSDSNSMSAPNASGGSSVDDATLHKAAQAYVKVKQIVHQAKQDSGDTTAQNSKQVESEKIDAVRSEGLDPMQYNQVIQMVENDPNLQEKFKNYVTQSGGDTD
jgi:hypothetical protein